MNMLETIFEAREEELVILDEQDKIFMKQDDANRNKKHNYLEQELNKIPNNLIWLKENIIKLIEDYVEAIDYEGAYFYKKYYLAGLKDGIKLQEEIK